MLAYRFSIIFGFLVAVLAGGAEDDGDLPQPTVTMIGCSSKKDNRCVLKAGEVATIVTEFTMPNTTRITSLRLAVDFQLEEMEEQRPYGIGENLMNSCNHLVGKQCPLVAGDKVRHILNLPVQSFNKPGKIFLKFLDDEKAIVSQHEESVIFA